jgi:hypothetical protein
MYRRLALLTLAAFGLSSSVASSQAKKDLPLKLPPRPTKPKITTEDLMTRLYIFADDSMMGREVHTEGNVKGTDYIASELKKMGLKPAGDNGTFFQTVPYTVKRLDPASSVVAGDKSLAAWSEFGADVPWGKVRPVGTVEAIYGGSVTDTANYISAEAAAGKLVVISGRLESWGVPGQPDAGGKYIVGPDPRRFATAAGIAVVVPEAQQKPEGNPHPAVPKSETAPERPIPERALSFWVTPAGAEALLGSPVADAKPGLKGKSVKVDIRFDEVPYADKPPARNVVAILPGSDPNLKNTYVAVGAHNDHIGISGRAIDHDSVRAFRLEYARRLRAEEGNWPKDAKERRAADSTLRASIKINVDSIRKLRPIRMDSINNGADDDGSGSVAVLEIAEAMAKLPAKPKRSILFVFHTGEESGLDGSKYFTAVPTVPRDSIVAQINIDMIGRGSLNDTPEGGDNMLMVVGSKRLSTELGEMVESVNTNKKHGIRFEYSWDAPDHRENVYYRSDHYEYAKYNIPIAFFFTGLHVDYHKVTDEPQYIDYDHLNKIANYLYDLVMTVGTTPKRPVVDRKTTTP